tara:strand:- start:19660 stop:20805 length:1146 start_codon:yes stop_codon:yes gene_type:complete
MKQNRNNEQVLVIVQLTGGNDFMNTLIPYTSSVYHDSRPVVGIPEDKVIPMNNRLGWHPSAEPLKNMFDQGKVAVVQGIGYPNSSRSHFRAMDIWHTCEPVEVGTEGWLGKATRELDPKGNNVLTAVNFGRGLPRALAVPGVPVTSVGNLENYGLMTGIDDNQDRNEALNVFKQMYAPAIGTGVVTDYLARTGLDVIKGADQLKKAPALYKSEIEYGNSSIGQSLRDAARVHLANLGTRILYTAHGGYDTHANEVPTHPQLLADLTRAISDFFDDLRSQDASENVTMLVFTEFGRRIKDNASGTDHGTGGGAFIIGDKVKGGLYSEYPSLDSNRWANGEDLEHTIDFRGIYGTILEQWIGIDATDIVGGSFEQIHPFTQTI